MPKALAKILGFYGVGTLVLVRLMATLVNLFGPGVGLGNWQFWTFSILLPPLVNCPWALWARQGMEANVRRFAAGDVPIKRTWPSPQEILWGPRPTD